MQAVVLHELGPAENLRLETVADPQPGPGEVVVRLHAAALNHRDLWIRKGLYAGIKLPIILGSDGHAREQVANVAAPLEMARRVGVSDEALYDPERHGSRTGAFAA